MSKVVQSNNPTPYCIKGNLFTGFGAVGYIKKISFKEGSLQPSQLKKRPSKKLKKRKDKWAGPDKLLLNGVRGYLNGIFDEGEFQDLLPQESKTIDAPIISIEKSHGLTSRHIIEWVEWAPSKYVMFTVGAVF